MAIEWRDVYSTRVERLGYDPETQEMYVEWKRGRVSVFEGVPDDVAHEASNAWSVGAFLRINIEPEYKQRYHDE